MLIVGFQLVVYLNICLFDKFLAYGICLTFIGAFIMSPAHPCVCIVFMSIRGVAILAVYFLCEYTFITITFLGMLFSSCLHKLGDFIEVLFTYYGDINAFCIVFG